ncbi:hypothetical protein IWX50DRAFT_656134 [Phyllosticta citricarpa]|uniref:Rhodopsin domain-containing protein n=1 Tax=Phyllosticta citricarpa TaxID=55181 RepID=A0ABR1MDK0_9PEZI
MVMEAQHVTVLPPPFKITATDHRGVLVVVASVTLTFVVTCLFIRVYLRSRTKDWRRDDTILALATLCCCFQGASVFVMIHEGTGMLGVDDANIDRLGSANYSQQTLYLITLFFSKTVVVFLYLRLTVHRKRAIAIYCTLALIVLWLIVSLILLAIFCNPKEYWTKGDQCPHNIAWRWDIISSLDITTEAILFLIAVSMVVGLQMPLRTKMIIIAVFSVRLPLVATASARLHYIHRLNSSPTPSLEVASAIICSQFQLDFAVMTSTICCLGPFLRPFEDDSSPSTTLPSHVTSHGDRSNIDSSINRTKRRSRVGALGPECGRLGGSDGMGPDFCSHSSPWPWRGGGYDSENEIDSDEVRLCGMGGHVVGGREERKGRGEVIPMTILRSATTSPRARGRRSQRHGRNGSSLSLAARSPPQSSCPSRSLSVASAQRRTLGLGLGIGSVSGTQQERDSSRISSGNANAGNGGAAGFAALELRPDFCQHTTYAARDETGAVSISELDGVSLASGDSQRLIIAKTVVTVDVEEPNAITPAGPSSSAARSGSGIFAREMEGRRRNGDGDCDEGKSWTESQTVLVPGMAL